MLAASGSGVSLATRKSLPPSEVSVCTLHFDSPLAADSRQTEAERVSEIMETFDCNGAETGFDVLDATVSFNADGQLSHSVQEKRKLSGGFLVGLAWPLFDSRSGEEVESVR